MAFSFNGKYFWCTCMHTEYNFWLINHAPDYLLMALITFHAQIIWPLRTEQEPAI